MDPEIDAILVQRLADLGREAGAVAGSIGGAAAGLAAGGAGTGTAGAGGGRGGGRGAAWTARRLRTETAVESAHFEPARAQAVVRTLAGLLATTNSGDEQRAANNPITLRGVVGSGFGGLNPAYLIAVIEPAAGVLTLAAHAKEGLIKQHTAAKAVGRILSALPVS